MKTPTLAPVYLDNEPVGLLGDPKPRVSKVVAASGKHPDAFEIRRLSYAQDTKGKALPLDFVIDRTEAPTRVIYLTCVDTARAAPSKTPPAAVIPAAVQAEAGGAAATQAVPVVVLAKPAPTEKPLVTPAKAFDGAKPVAEAAAVKPVVKGVDAAKPVAATVDAAKPVAEAVNPVNAPKAAVAEATPALVSKPRQDKVGEAKPLVAAAKPALGDAVVAKQKSAAPTAPPAIVAEPAVNPSAHAKGQDRSPGRSDEWPASAKHGSRPSSGKGESHRGGAPKEDAFKGQTANEETSKAAAAEPLTDEEE